MECKINGSSITATIGESARMDVEKAVSYIKSGKAEIDAAVDARLGEIDAEGQEYVDLAKDWAIKTDGTVDGVDYSSKYYAQSILPLASDITTIASMASDVTAVGSNIAKVTAVADNETNINAVNANETNISAVASNATNINAVAGNETNINAVNANSANINTVAGIASDVTTVAGDTANIATVVDNLDAINDAPTYANNAYVWAEGIDADVQDLGGTHSSKGWAQIAEAAASGVQNPANRDLSNLSNAGNLVIDSQNGTISNCIVDIPQNLKLEFSNGTVTLKAGSVVTRSGSTYQTVTTTSDTSWTTATLSNTRAYLFVSNYGYAQVLYGRCAIDKVGSGSSLPADGNTYSLFFNTTDKIVYNWNNGAWSATTDAYPLGIVEVNGSGNITGFAKDSNGNDMIFNGAGFVGHHSFTLPNVKGLFANSKDKGGRLSSSQFTSSSLSIVELTTVNKNVEAFSNSTIVPRYDIGEFDNKDDLPTNISSTYYTAYVKSENAKYYKGMNNAWSLQLGHYLNLVDFTYDGTTVTDFTICQPYEDARNLLTDDIEEQVAAKQADVTTLTGYDSTQTQTLKSINGVLTWVTD